MTIATKIQSMAFNVNRGGNIVRNLWDRLSPLPGGRFAFSAFIGQVAPYTGSIRAHILELRSGYARATITDHRAVRNHLDCVHAMALVNLGEITGNLAIFYSLPDDARLILSGLEIEYLKKARGRITAESHCPVPEDRRKKTYEVPVSLRDQSGEEVARVILQTLVGPKRRS